MQRYVIPDIHGCANTLQALLDKIGLSQSDQLYLLGDYIDRGKNSAGVLDSIISLQEQSYQVFPLRGNHEENLLHAYHNYNPKVLAHYITKLSKSNLLNDQNEIPIKYIDFITSLPDYYELDNYWLVHAGFDTTKDNFLQDRLAMLEIRKFEYHAERLKGKRIIHGHQVIYDQEIKQRLDQGAMVLPLDNGCVYNTPHKKYDYTQTGHLNCLELEALTLTQIRNID